MSLYIVLFNNKELQELNNGKQSEFYSWTTAHCFVSKGCIVEAFWRVQTYIRVDFLEKRL